MRLHATAVLAAALALAACDNSVAPVQPPTGAVASPFELADATIPNGPLPIEITTGSFHVCGRLINGAVRCWGDNLSGQAPDMALQLMSTIDAGDAHTCGVSEGTAVCYGDNTLGQAPASRPPTTGAFVSIAAGAASTCALREDGAVECWGKNDVGQAPAVVTPPNESESPFVQVALYATHGCALDQAGLVTCWGDNSDGKAPAAKTARNGKFKQIALGNSHSCGLRASGTDVYCWGSNAAGQAPVRRTPTTGKYRQIVAGYNHTCALRTDGVAECWGDNSSGQAPAEQLAESGAFRSLSAHGDMTCGLRVDRLVDCWGDLGEDPEVSPFGRKYRFGGFFGSWKNTNGFSGSHLVTVPNAGRSLYIRFTLRGDEGLDILAPDSPKLVVFPLCEFAPEEGAATGQLSYSAETDRYTYRWDIPPLGIPGCVIFNLILKDGTMKQELFTMVPGSSPP